MKFPEILYIVRKKDRDTPPYFEAHLDYTHLAEDELVAVYELHKEYTVTHSITKSLKEVPK